MKKSVKKIVCALSILCVLLSVMIVPISADDVSATSSDNYNDYVNAWYILPIIDGRSWFVNNYGNVYGTSTFPDMVYSFSTKYADFEVTDDTWENFSDGTYYIGTGYFGFYSTSRDSYPRSSFHADGYVIVKDGEQSLSTSLEKELVLRFVSTTEDRVLEYHEYWSYYGDYGDDKWYRSYSWLTHTLDGVNVISQIDYPDVSFFLAYHLSETVVSDVPVYSLAPFIEEFYGLTKGNWYDVSFLDEYACGYSTGYENGYYTGESDGLGTGYTNGYEAGYADGETDTYLPAYNEGYTDGYDTGYETATAEHADNYDRGYTLGYDNGWYDGEQYGVWEAKKNLDTYYNDYWATHYNTDAYGNAVKESIESEDSNPVTAFFNSMWNGIINAYDTVTQNVSVGGISLAMVITTLIVAVIVIFVVKLVR